MGLPAVMPGQAPSALVVLPLFCAVCTICERIGGFSQKSQNPQKQIINLFNQINLSEPPNSPFCAICERGVTTTAFVLGRIAIRPYGTRRNSMYNYLIISNINRASGYSLCNLMLTASEAEPATWGKPIKPIAINRGAVADSAVEDNSRFS